MALIPYGQTSGAGTSALAPYGSTGLVPYGSQPVAPPPQQPEQQTDSGGWGWNPLSDLAKAGQIVGDFVSEHTGGKKLGLGTFVSMPAQIPAGLFHAVEAATTGDFEPAKQFYGAGLSGFGNLIGDVVSFGGTVPYLREQYQIAERQSLRKLGVSHPEEYVNTLAEAYNTGKGGGLVGQGLSDVGSAAVVAGGVGAIAKLGAVGSAAELANAAADAAIANAIKGGVDVEEAASLARGNVIADQAAKIAESSGKDVGEVARIIENRANTLRNIKTIQNATDKVFNPISPLRAVWKPLGRAATLERTLGPEEATIAGEANVGGVAAPEAPTPGGVTLMKRVPTEVLPAVKEGYTRLWNGGEGAKELWTTDQSRASSYATDRNPLQYVDVPTASVERLRTTPGSMAHRIAQEEGNQPNTASDVWLRGHPRHAELVSQATDVPTEVRPVTTPAPGKPKIEAPKAERPVPANKLENEPTPSEIRGYKENAGQVPPWARKIVGKLPEPVRDLLHWANSADEAHRVAVMTRQQERVVQYAAQKVWESPEIRQMIEEEKSLAKKAGMTAAEADRAVSQRVRMAVANRPLWHDLEARRAAVDLAHPGAVDRMLRFKDAIPNQINTAEWRDRIGTIADRIIEARHQALEDLRLNPRTGAKGVGPEITDRTMPTLTKKERDMLANIRDSILEEAHLQAKGIPEARAAADVALGELHGKQAVAQAAMEAKMAAYKEVGQRIQEGDTSPQTRNEYRVGVLSHRTAQRAHAAVVKDIQDLQEKIYMGTLPSQVRASQLKARANDLIVKLNADLEDATGGRVPPTLRPAVLVAHDIAKEVAEHPDLAPMLGDLPQTLGAAYRQMVERGFDPAHMRDFTETEVRNLAYALGKLGRGNITNEFTAGTRKTSKGFLRAQDLAADSTAAFVASLVEGVHEARTNHIVDYIERNLAVAMPKNADGKPVLAPGYHSWADTRRSLLTIEKDGERIGYGTDLMIPDAVWNTLQRYGKDYNNPFTNALRKITNPWKQLVLTFSPKFYLNHIVGHMMLAGLAGGLSDPMAWVKAWKAWRKDAYGERFSSIPEVKGGAITTMELGPEGMIHDTYRQRIQSLRNEGKKLPVIRGVHSELSSRLHGVVQTGDSFGRAVAFFAQLKKHGGDTLENRMIAMQYASAALVDYGNLSSFERGIVRNIIPFYSFEKGILKVLVQYPLDHPFAASLWMKLGLLNERWAVDANGNPLPDAYSNVVNLPGLGPVNIKGLNPFKDIHALTTPEGIVSSLQYALQAAARAGFGVPAPGTKAGTKIGPTGALIPDVSLGSQILGSLASTPQGALLSNNTRKGPVSAISAAVGLPEVSGSTLTNAANRLAVSKAAMATPQDVKDAAARASYAVGQATLLSGANTTLQAAVAPGGSGTTLTASQQQAVQAAVAAELAKRKEAGKKAGASRRRSGGAHRTRVSRRRFRVRAAKVGKLGGSHRSLKPRKLRIRKVG